VNKNRKPNANNIGALKVILPAHNVASQLNILIPVGTAIVGIVTWPFFFFKVFHSLRTGRANRSASGSPEHKDDCVLLE
jgi:hypothetical protein